MIIAGISYLNIDGQTYSTEGKFDISIQNIKQESKIATNGKINIKQEAVVSYISGTIYVDEGVNIEDLSSLTNVNVTVTTAGGNTYGLTGANAVDEFKLDTSEGTVSFKFEGTGHDYN